MRARTIYISHFATGHILDRKTSLDIHSLFALDRAAADRFLEEPFP